MTNKNQELIFAGIVLLLVIRNLMIANKTPFDWVMILVGVGLLARQGYAMYQARQ